MKRLPTSVSDIRDQLPLNNSAIDRKDVCDFTRNTISTILDQLPAIPENQRLIEDLKRMDTAVWSHLG